MMGRAVTLTPEVLEALKGSIKKWKKIVAGRGRDLGVGNCPLCTMFFYDKCRGCPVARRTGKKYCRGSPYARWADAMWDPTAILRPRNARDAKFVELARAELKFLERLLPKAKVKRKTRLN